MIEKGGFRGPEKEKKEREAKHVPRSIRKLQFAAALLGGLSAYSVMRPESQPSVGTDQVEQGIGSRNHADSKETNPQEIEDLKRKILIAAEAIRRIDTTKLKEADPVIEITDEEYEIYDELEEAIDNTVVTIDDIRGHANRDPEEYGNLFTRLPKVEGAEQLFDEYISQIEISKIDGAQYITLDGDYGFDLVVEPTWDEKTHEPIVKMSADDGYSVSFRVYDLDSEGSRKPEEALHVLIRSFVSNEVIRSVHRTVEE